MSMTVVSRNFQITLPKEIREPTNISIGDKMLYVFNKAGEIVLKKIKRDPIERAFGTWKTKETGTEYVDRIRGEWEDRE